MSEATQAQAFVKRSDDSRTAGVLKAEGEMLKVAAHPGVVEMIRSEGSGAGWQIVLRRVHGSDLTRQPPWTAEEVAGFGAAAATTLADLHDLGVVHGRLGPEHLLADESGRPVLCGFSQARRCLDDPAADDRKAADVADLVQCLAARLPAGAPRALRRALDRAVARRGRRPMTARQLAGALSASVAGATLPARAPLDQSGGSERPSEVDGEAAVHGSLEEARRAPADPDVDAGREVAANLSQGAANLSKGAANLSKGAANLSKGEAGRRAALPAIVVGVLLMGLAGGLFLLTTHSQRTHAPTSGSPASSRSGRGATAGVDCPAVDKGCRPIPNPNGVLTLARGRYRIGEAGDVLVLGRWTCRAVALPALLRPNSGQVWAFGRWAEPGRDTTAVLLGRVAGARSLRVLPGVNGCDRLEVMRRVGSPVAISWPRRRRLHSGAVLPPRGPG
ncbi:MAG: hypothetical protein J2O47_00730 [Acidimicrobiaceae bacterium]|nr:hypothetical protein [Acidimicrobiaceae bacterium]